MTPTSTLLSRRLGFLLRQARERAGLTQDQVALQLERDRTTIGRLESGQGKIRLSDLRAWMDLLEITDPEQRAELEQLTRSAGERGWWAGAAGAIRKTYETYCGFEAGAAELFGFETIAVPGLLQTERYATALLSTIVPALSTGEIAARVAVRMKRQERVHSGELAVTVVIDESILFRTIGGEDVWREQMEFLADAAAKPNIHLQVLPFATPAHPGALGAFVVLRFDGDPMIAYVESAAGDLIVGDQTALNYRDMFTALAIAALPAEMSRQRILARLNKGVST